jgi:hypothetical protein
MLHANKRTSIKISKSRLLAGGGSRSLAGWEEMCFDFHHDTIPSVSSIFTFKYTLSQKPDVRAVFFAGERGFHAFKPRLVVRMHSFLAEDSGQHYHVFTQRIGKINQNF